MNTVAATRILVIEDDDSVRHLVADALTDRGYRVLTAGDGLEALAMLRAGTCPFDLVISDVVLPGVCGAALAEQVRAAAPGIPILHMSGHHDEVVARHGIPPDGPGFLRKPFSTIALADLVRGALSPGPA